MSFRFILRTLAVILFAASIVTAVSLRAQEPQPAVPSAEIPSAVVPASENQLPQGRDRYSDELNKESSSFVSDPDPLDPLPLRQESLKEDEEPVLDDIKQVLNRPKTKKPTKPKTPSPPVVIDQAPAVLPSTTQTDLDFTSPTPQPSVQSSKAQSSTKTGHKTSIKKNRKEARPQEIPAYLQADDPDLNLEQRLHDVYQTYNAQPTPAELWSQLAATQQGNIYVVQKGDTLYSISGTLFGDTQFWPKIWSINKFSILNPHQIYPGMNIVFMPSVDGSVPSLRQATVKPENILNSTPNANPGDVKADDRDYSVQKTEFGRLETSSQAESGDFEYGKIPDSLPYSRNDKYFSNGAGKAFTIELKDLPRLPATVPENPYMLSSQVLKTSFTVPDMEVSGLYCKEKLYLPKVTPVDPNASAGDYVIVELRNGAMSRLKKTQVYKIVGSARVFSNMSMRILNCNQHVNRDALFVPRSALLNLPPATEEIAASSSQIVEGLEYEAQTVFSENQFVIVNLKNLPAPEGQNLSVYSESLGGPVGTARLVKRSGSMGIAVVTDVNEFMQLGDKVSAEH